MSLEKAIEDGIIQKTNPSEDLIEKELNEAKYDLKRAESAFEENDFKWCIVKSYYSMFHASKAIMYKFGYREKRHFAIQIFLDYLSKQGKLEEKYVQLFSLTMEAREDADYRYTYSEQTAEEILGHTRDFLSKIKSML